MSIPRKPTAQLNNQAAAATAQAQVIPNIPAPAPAATTQRNQSVQGAQGAQNHATRSATTRTARSISAQPSAQSAAQRSSPFDWLFTPVSVPQRRGVRKGDLVPAIRATLLFGGVALWLCGGFLTNVVMSKIFPSTSQVLGKDINIGALVSTLIASIFFLLVELYLWKGTHSLIVWCLLFAVLGADIYINCKGFMQLLQFDNFHWLDEASALVLIVGGGIAVLPEKFMSAAWE